MQEPASAQIIADDDRMVMAAKENPARFAGLYERYYLQILGFVYQRVTTKEDAYDITQQVFLQAMVSLSKYESRGFPFSSWLYRIAINEMNGIFRRNEKRRGVNFNENQLKDIAVELGGEDNEWKEDAVIKAITTLDEEDYQIVEMRFFEKRPFKEIAGLLDINEASAKMRLYRVLEKLRPEVERNIKMQM